MNVYISTWGDGECEIILKVFSTPESAIQYCNECIENKYRSIHEWEDCLEDAKLYQKNRERYKNCVFFKTEGVEELHVWEFEVFPQ